MKVAINCVFFQPQSGGIREYIYNLVTNLAECEIGEPDEYILYVASDYEDYARRQWAHLPSNFRIKVTPFRASGLLHRIYRSLTESHYWHREEDLENWDIFHSPFFHSHQPRRARLVMTVHDLRIERYPESYAMLRRIFLRRAVRQSVKRADALIAVSQFTKDELISIYSLDENKISVIHEGLNSPYMPQRLPASEEETPAMTRIKGKYILSVGHLEPRKNYRRLIDAFEKIRDEEGFEDINLVIVGRRGHDYKSLLHRIEADKRVIWLDFVSPQRLQKLYREAEMLVFPSYYEGFGFPPLEAGAEGTVSAVSRVSSMPEICSDGVVYFNPFDIDSIAGAIRKIQVDPLLRRQLRQSMRTRITTFSWIRNATLTRQLYQSATPLRGMK